MSAANHCLQLTCVRYHMIITWMGGWGWGMGWNYGDGMEMEQLISPCHSVVRNLEDLNHPPPLRPPARSCMQWRHYRFYAAANDRYPRELAVVGWLTDVLSQRLLPHLFRSLLCAAMNRGASRVQLRRITIGKPRSNVSRLKWLLMRAV